MFSIGANPWIWTSPVTDEALSYLVPDIAAWGFNTIEIPMENPGDWSPERTRDLLEAHGLTAAAVLAVTPPGRDLVRTGPRKRRASQAYLRMLIDAAVVLGAPSVCGPVYSAVGRLWRMTQAERAECYGELRAALAPIADYAADRGVQIGLEALNRYETSVLNTVAQTLEALAGLPSTVGIMLDSYHMNIEESDPYAAIGLAGPRLVHVQVSGSDRGAPGRDHIDWPRWLQALSATGYRGAICIESFTGENEAIAIAAAIWRPLAPTQNELATAGLAHLREIIRTLPT